MGGAGTAVKLSSHFHMAQHLVEAGEDGLDHASLCREAQASDVRRVDMVDLFAIFETVDWHGATIKSACVSPCHVTYVMYPSIS